MVRFYEILAVVVLLGCGAGAVTGTWFTSVDTVEGIPKNARQAPGAYRSHYRHVYIRGGK